MAARTTRTLNPLPFADLEPHRFEDLVRQLAYEFRPWHSLEAIGRSGSDEGMDIRGQEIVPTHDERDEVVDDEQPEPGPQLRSWIFQCKREKTMGPKAVRDTVADSIPPGTSAPHGFVLATSADLSKKARDAFRAEMVARGVEEFHAWARGELEDMLFQPRNDRLLFAYFGLSLQPRRRSLATKIRSEVALKKLLRRLFQSDDGGSGKHEYLLLRDPNDDRYPHEPKDEAAKRPRWLLCEFYSLHSPGQLAVIDREHYAWVSFDQKAWDYLPQDNLVPGQARARFPIELDSFRDSRKQQESGAHAFWDEYVPEGERAYFKGLSLVPLDQIIAVDPIGDGYFPVPQVMVEFDRDLGPFRGDLGAQWLERTTGYATSVELRPTENTRVRFFPEPLPEHVFPPPPKFHHEVPNERRSLSITAKEALDQLFQDAPEREVEPPNEVVAHGATEEAKKFSSWSRDTVLPAFGAALHFLGDRGFGGRIVFDDPAAHSERQSTGSVELRIRPSKGTRYNPDYRPLVALRFSWTSHHDKVSIHFEPSDLSSSSTNRDLKQGIDELTAEAVEAHVVEMVNRIIRKPWW